MKLIVSCVFFALLLVCVAGSKYTDMLHKTKHHEKMMTPIGPQVSHTRKSRLWPNNTMPWNFNPDKSNFTDFQKSEIRRAMTYISNISCIKFVERTTETAYATFQNQESPGDCSSGVGYSSGANGINIADWCIVDWISVVHEIYHALGFEHEHSRYDRDLYVEVLWENISEGMKLNYEKEPRTTYYSRYQYEYVSMMHYSISNGATGPDMKLLKIYENPDIKEMDVGKSKVITQLEKQKLNLAYNCDTNTVK